jgi:uncharacterized protein YaiI (UPF0178 family)
VTTTIYVDADACPVKDEVLRVAARHSIPVVLVSNRGMRTGDDPLVRSVLVDHGADAADDWIVDNLAAGDLVITADIRLAARCLERKARALNPNGNPFDERSIGMAVAMRNLMAALRDQGAITGGGAGFSKQDRSRFLSALETAVRAVLRPGTAG